MLIWCDYLDGLVLSISQVRQSRSLENDAGERLSEDRQGGRVSLNGNWGASKYDRHYLPRGRHSRAAALCRLRRRPAEELTVDVELIYAAGAVLIAGYMVAALLRPDKF